MRKWNKTGSRRGMEGCRRQPVAGRGRLTGLALALLLLLPLGACAPGAGEPPDNPLPEELRLAEDAILVYYTIGNRYDYGGGGNRYGLLNAQGEFVLEQAYSYISEVYGNAPYGKIDAVELERPYFYAARYEELTDELLAQAESDGWVNLSMYYALVSPDGEILSDFAYTMISLAPSGSTHPVVALRTDNTFVWLDEAGAEHALNDEALLRTLRELYLYRLIDSEQYNNRQGPDVPEEGFETMLELEDGRYWGGYGVWELEDWSDYRQVVNLYSAGGERISDREYNSISHIGGGLYAAWEYGFMNDFDGDRCYFVDESGIPLREEVYDAIWYYSIEPYIAAQQGTEVTVFERDGLREQMRFELPDAENINLWGYEFHGRPCMAVSGEDLPPRILFFDQPGEEIALDAFPGYSIDYCNEDFTRFVLSPAFNGKGEYHYLLVSGEGEIFMQSEYSLYPAASNGRVIQVTELSDGRYRQGLCDWDGEMLLPCEYSEMYALGANALHVVRGDWTGIVDFAGNWIYRESLFKDLV